MNASLSVDLATNVLQDIVRQQPITAEQVLTAVAGYYQVDLADLTGRSRNRDIVLPRQMAMYLLREETNASLPQIGEVLGGRDHTTVIYAHEKMTQEIETNDTRRRELLAIRERLYQAIIHKYEQPEVSRTSGCYFYQNFNLVIVVLW